MFDETFANVLFTLLKLIESMCVDYLYKIFSERYEFEMEDNNFWSQI